MYSLLESSATTRIEYIKDAKYISFGIEPAAGVPNRKRQRDKESQNDFYGKDQQGTPKEVIFGKAEGKLMYKIGSYRRQRGRSRRFKAVGLTVFSCDSQERLTTQHSETAAGDYAIIYITEPFIRE